MLDNTTFYGVDPERRNTGKMTLTISLALEAMHQFKAAIAEIMSCSDETSQAAGRRGLPEAVKSQRAPS